VAVPVAPAVGVAPVVCWFEGATRTHWIVRLVASVGISVPCPALDTNQGGMVQQND
jgi:hypothetical protein